MTGVLISRRSTKSRALARYSRLDVQRAGLAAVGQPDLAPAGHVVGDLADRADRVLHREVAHHHALLDHPQHQVAARPP